MFAKVRRGPVRGLTWPGAARAGQIQWLCGNLYEALADMPRLLADARPARRPGVLAPGSPLRYYAPLAPVTLTATAVSVVWGWRSGGDRRVLATAALGTASSVALTAHLVRTVNLRLLNGQGALDESEVRELVGAWHRFNLMRMVLLGASVLALHQEARRVQSP